MTLWARARRSSLDNYFWINLVNSLASASLIDGLETRSRSIQQGKSRRSAPEVFFSRLRLRPNTCRPEADETKLPDAREKKPLVPRVSYVRIRVGVFQKLFSDGTAGSSWYTVSLRLFEFVFTQFYGNGLISWGVLPYFVVTQVPFFCVNAFSSRLDLIITEDTSVQAQLAS